MLNSSMTLAAAMLLLGTAAPLRAQPAGGAVHDVRVTKVDGEVTLYTAEDPEGIPAEVDTPLEEGDRLVTGDGASAEIAFDGGNSVVTINPSSDFTLRGAQRSSTVLELATGSLLAKIRKLLAGDNLQVRAPSAVAAVRGTEFGVEAENGAQAHVGVFDEGRVEVTGQSGPPQVLEPNQETSVVKGAPAQPPRQLQRFLQRREFMRQVMRERSRRLAQRWKTLPPDRRQELRRKALVRMRQQTERRRGMQQRLRDRRREREQRRRARERAR